MGNRTLIATEAWPVLDASVLVEDEVELVVQVRGKLAQTISVPIGIDEAAALQQALALQSVKRQLKGTPSRVVFVPDRVINLIP